MSGDLWGAVLAVIAAVLSNIGTNAQKHSHLLEDKRAVEDRRHYLKRPFWWVGFAGVLLAAIGDFLALAFASQALVAALGGGCTLLTNVLVAQIWNGDRLVWSDAVGVALIIGGAVYFAVEQKAEDIEDIKEIQDNFTKKWFLVYLIGQGCVIFLLLAGIANSCAYAIRLKWTETLFSPLVSRLDQQNDRIAKLEDIIHERFPETPRRTTEGGAVQMACVQLLRVRILNLLVLCVYGLPCTYKQPAVLSSPPNSTVQCLLRLQLRAGRARVDKHADGSGTPLTPKGASPEMERILELKWYDKYIYAACAGAIGGLSVLFGSCTGKSLSCSECSFGDAFSHTYFYGFLVSMLVCVIVQTHLLNKAMQLGGTMSVFPVFEAFWISFGVIGGLVFYNDDKTSWTDDVRQGAGVFFMLVGVVFLMLHPESETDRDNRETREQNRVDLLDSLDRMTADLDGQDARGNSSIMQ